MLGFLNDLEEDTLWLSWRLHPSTARGHLREGSRRLTLERQMALFPENVRRCVNSLPLLNVVDKRRGY